MGAEAEPSSAKDVTKRKQNPRPPTRPKKLSSTSAGDKVADQLGRKLAAMLNAAAVIEASRRRATAVDSTDYERGFDTIVSPSR